jgi:hypothetical protein
MTGMNVVWIYLVQEKCFATSGEISTSNEKSSGLFCLYQAQNRLTNKGMEKS